ncbi:MAG: TetR/AcrR family transcriptional regulator [Pseudomonadota bacterium]
MAADLFMEKGYAGTSMAHVANAAGLRKASLYHHFASKEALFVAAMTLDLAEGASRLERLRRDATLDHDARFRRALEIIYDVIVTSPAGRMAPVVAETAQRVPEVAQGFYDGFIERMTGGMAAIVDDAVRDGVMCRMDPGTLYHLVFGPPVNIALSRSMFHGVAAAQAHLDVETARSGHETALLHLLCSSKV